MRYKTSWSVVRQRPVLRRPVIAQLKRSREAHDLQFRKNGYVVVPAVLEQKDVGRLRNVCQKYMSDYADTEMVSSHFLSIKELAAIPFNPTVVNILRDVLGDGFTIYPNFRVSANLFTDWHVDNNYRSEFYTNDAFVHSTEFCHAQCLLYLQDNDIHIGGGLDVLPGSHCIVGTPQSAFFRKLNRVANVLRRPISLPTRAGDLVIIDIRLLHRGTQPRAPSERTKFFISWSASRTTESHLSRFMRYYKTRRDHLMQLHNRSPLHESILRKYDDLISVKYPDDYPDSVVQTVIAQGIHVESGQRLDND